MASSSDDELERSFFTRLNELEKRRRRICSRSKEIIEEEVGRALAQGEISEEAARRRRSDFMEDYEATILKLQTESHKYMELYKQLRVQETSYEETLNIQGKILRAERRQVRESLVGKKRKKLDKAEARRA